MAKFPDMVMTLDGLNMIAQAGSGNEDDKLIITGARLGDGTFSGNIRELTDVVAGKLDVALSSISNEGNGKIKATFTYDNSDVEVGFYHREIGILAKNGTNGQEKLLSYSNAGSNYTYLPDKSEAIPLQTMILGIAIGDLENVEGEVNLSNAITEGRLKEELEKYLPLSGGTMAGLLSLFSGSTITTPAANDNSKKIVNSEWVQALIKNIISELSENLEVRWSGSTFTVPALGITGLMAQNGYISLGKLFGGLILQWGSVVATGLPYPWKFNYPVSLKSTILGISIVRLSGAGAFSEIIQERTLSYLTWIDKDHTNETGGGDAVNFIIIGV